MRGTTDEEDGVMNFSDVLMMSDDVLSSGEVEEDSFGFRFTGNDAPQMLCFGGGNQNDTDLLFSQPSFSPASPLSSRNNACVVNDQSFRSNKKTGSADGHDRVCDPKPGKRCKRDQKKSSLGNAKDDEDTGEVNPTMKVKELRSNGLCLVPLAWTVHVANTNGADLWSSAILSPLTSHTNSEPVEIVEVKSHKDK
ncbi:hypothetical protein; 14995-13447 [Arabidopsis thaliana]|uniref:Uncharacterized protein F10F5.7 n=1 Tax=Arabidopsis thaliana TaxID=3702 RepID=Q9C6D1_ARATH|nr:hypothetical protein; 14995-13447 [Arabidopsis thaliana]